MSLATKHNDPDAPLGWGERIGYGTGGFAFNMINGIIGSFLTIYFTSAVGLNVGIIATIFAVSKVFDGISDLIVGRMVDRTKSKLGKGRAWLAYMCIPFAVTTMLLFYVPQNIPEMAQYVYIFLMYNIVNAVCLTGMLVPYYSMVSLITANPYERGFLGNIQQIFQTLGNVYFCQYVLYDMGQYGALSNAISIAQLGIMFVTPIFMKKFDKSKIYIAGMAVMAVGFLGFGLVGESAGPALMIVFNVLKGCGVGMAGGMALGMVADTVTYGTLKSGIDTVGMGNAGISAAQKVGLGLGTAVFGWVIDAAGFDGALDA